MKRLNRAAIITQLIDKLHKYGSWCGETHVQKITFILQNLMQVPLKYEFILYKHGPFSFDLRDELTSLRADGLIELEPQQLPYGPKIVTTSRSRNIAATCSKTIAKYNNRIDFIAKTFNDKGVTELERLATAYFVTMVNNSVVSVDERVKQITKLKPHILIDNARSAVSEIDNIIMQAQHLLKQ